MQSFKHYRSCGSPNNNINKENETPTPRCTVFFKLLNFKTSKQLQKMASVVQEYRRVAKNSQWGGGLFRGFGGGAPSRRRPMGVRGQSPQPPEAGGSGAKPPAAGGTGVWGRSPQRSKILHFFAKLTSF